MPKPLRKPRTKGSRLSKPDLDGNVGDGNVGDGPPVAIAEPPSEELRPPTTPVETETRDVEKPAVVVEDKDRIAATSLNIAKLQALAMADLNQMARDMGVE